MVFAPFGNEGLVFIFFSFLILALENWDLGFFFFLLSALLTRASTWLDFFLVVFIFDCPFLPIMFSFLGSIHSRSFSSLVSIAMALIERAKLWSICLSGKFPCD